MPANVTLYTRSASTCTGQESDAATNNPPNMNIAMICNFSLVGICSFHSGGMGNAIIMKSVSTFNAPKNMAPLFE